MIAVLLRADGNWKLNDLGTKVLCFCKQFCWLNSLANKNKTEQWEPQFLHNPTLEKSEYRTAASTMPAGYCLATCMAVQRGWDHCPPVLRDLGTKGVFLQARTSAGPLQVSSVPASMQKLWSGGPGDCKRLPVCLGRPTGAVQWFITPSSFSSRNQQCLEEAGDGFAVMVQTLEAKNQEKFSG